ncbi:Transcriptional regulatory protein BaeR [Thiocapsa sp. KS1]|nr:response regulator [Thiocapsa sp. KS1]CRI65213.1 Transcriptional regulatory protein BaeR [Thiocapsa sp. KS1]
MRQTSPHLILIVEDEERLAAVVADYLRAAGYRVHHLPTGTGAVDWIERERPDLVLLDLMLPGRDGLSICREVRGRSQVPIIMTTARVEEIDRLLGLELGADDYVCKPYSPRELVARVKAVLRRASRSPESPTPGVLALEPDRLQVSHGSAVITLTAVEFALLAALHQAAGRILSRDFLMDRIYSDGRIVADRTIDSHIKKLRRRLGELVPDTELIHSVYGVGYRYEEPDPNLVGPEGNP